MKNTDEKNIKRLRNDKPAHNSSKDNGVKVAADVKKRVIRGGFSTIMVVLAIAIVVVLNVIASAVETKAGLKIDLTSNKIYSLSAQTESNIRSIMNKKNENGEYSNEFVIYSFANDYTQDNLIGKTLERYAALSNNITLSVLDPAKDSILRNKFSGVSDQVVEDKTVVVFNSKKNSFRVIKYEDMSYTDKENNVSYWTLEQKLTSAFMFLDSGRAQTNVYFLTGHGEAVTNVQFSERAKLLKEKLEEENFKVDNIDLAMNDLHSGDILIVIGPSSDISEQDRDKVIKFLDANGKALFFLDPSSSRLKNFEAILDHYMIKFKNEIVYENDKSRHRPPTDDPKAPLKCHFDLVPEVLSNKEITNGIINSKSSVYAGSCAYLEEYNPSSDLLTVLPLLNTSDRSVCIPYEDYITGAYENKMSEYTEEKRRCIGLALYQKDSSSMQIDEGTRICVFSSSELALGKRSGSKGNVDLIKNCVNWVDNKTNTISISGVQMNAYELSIADAATVKTLVTIVIIVIPVLILGGGVIIWLRRKNL